MTSSICLFILDKTTIHASNFDFGIQVLYVYNDDYMVLLEENLNYDPMKDEKQFHLIAQAKISDIVHLVSIDFFT